MNSEPVYHIPALLPQTIEALNIDGEGIYADATFGGGGHSRGILENLGESGRLYVFDQDDMLKFSAIMPKRGGINVEPTYALAISTPIIACD